MKSSTRNGVKVRALALHSTEGIMRAADLRDWASWPGSSHAAVDQYGALLDGAADGFVDYARAAWTIRNGNAWTDNLEQCALASWSRATWLSKPKLLEGAAQWLARRAKARGIPLRLLSVDQLRAGWLGVIDHDRYTEAYKDGSHWDVGTGYPFDVVLARAQQLMSGTVPAPEPPKRKRMSIGELNRDESTGAYYLVSQGGMRYLSTNEEVNVCAWQMDPARAANATFQHNARYHDVLLTVLAKPFITKRVTAGADGARELTLAPYTAPAKVEGADVIGPPPGFLPWDDDAPDHAG